MINSSIDFTSQSLHFEVPPATPSSVAIEVRTGIDADLAVLLYMKRDDVCRLFVALRGWLYATQKKAIKAGCYHDKEIIN